MKDGVVLNINGDHYKFSLGDRRGQIPYSETLVQTLRDRIGLQGKLGPTLREKIGLTDPEPPLSCGEGFCGRCAVLIDGKAIASCMTLTSECGGKKIVTLEGLRNKKTGEPDPVVNAVLDYPGFICRFCTPGIIAASQSLFNQNPHPSESEIQAGLAGNYCRLEKICGIRTQLVAHLAKVSASH
ncbi:MAG: 2Fe-2S iron-sulfur cluster-binding protein [Deltaproteobacteria bacterium]|nr:2Fe-2S iron-sulfur cluster-binding protein [Deltaproteobacteria bacterium]